MRAHGLHASVISLLPLLLACNGDGSHPSASAARDSAGVRIVENERPSWGEGEGWAVGEVLLTLGGGPGGDLFGVEGGVLLPGGGIAVANGGEAEVRFYDPSGALRSAFGGRGDGPGEFRMLASLGAAAGDTVWAYDYGLARLSLVTAGDGVVTTVPLRPPLGAGIVVGRSPDGSWIVGQLWGSSAGGSSEVEGLVRDPAVYARYGADGAMVDTLGLFPGREVLQRLEGRRMTMSTAPFARVSSHALLGDDLVVGDEVAREIRIHGSGGASGSIRWTGPSLRITDADVDAWTSALIASAAAQDRPSVRAQVADMRFPETRPAYGRILIDGDGVIWVAAYALPGADPTRWEVFGSTGRWLGGVDVPARFHVLDVGSDRILGVAHDALDVERVEVRRLSRAGR